MRSNLSFLPYFRIPLNRFNKINGGADLGNLANHASWNGKITITCGGVASGTKIRIIRICGVNSVATPPNQKHESKMITKVRYSKNPDKTIDYILNPKKGAYVVSARGVSSFTDRSILTGDFNRQCSLRPSLKVKAVHIPMSFHVNDSATLEIHAEEIIVDWIRHMERHGYCFDQFIIGRHHDKDDKNPHFHFLANVVLDDGTRANLANIGKAAKEASIEKGCRKKIKRFWLKIGI